MNFFKKLFSSKKQEQKQETKENNSERVNFDGIATEEYFNKRYQEEKIEDSIIEGAIKMIESYFVDNKLEKKVESPINHPVNLDQAIEEGFGFTMYCKAFNFEEKHALMFLVFAFNDFMIKNHGFKVYNDLEPEYPSRIMTLKYDNEGAQFSLYPIEYTSKVLRYEATFENLYKRVVDNLENMPSGKDIYNDLMNAIKSDDEK